MMSGHLGPVQFWLLLGGAAVATLAEIRERAAGPRIACLLAWSSVYLLACSAGVHPTQYYWCFPTALLCVCLGRAVSWLGGLLPGRPRPRLALKWAGAAVLIGLMLPGLGLRTWLAHLRHWGDVNYNAPAFARRILADLPPEARYTVDREFVLDFLAAGRTTILAETFALYFNAAEHPYDYLLVSRHGIEEQIPAALGGTLVRTYGERDDPFACYVEVYRAGDAAPTQP
jgi:hypothetical protein